MCAENLSDPYFAEMINTAFLWNKLHSASKVRQMDRAVPKRSKLTDMLDLKSGSTEMAATDANINVKPPADTSTIVVGIDVGMTFTGKDPLLSSVEQY